MTQKMNQVFSPGPNNTIVNRYGEIVPSPPGWEFLPAGDAGVTRKVTSKNNFWRIQKKKGRRTISLGIWAPAETIRQAKEEMAATRETESYKKRQECAAQRRNKKQDEYKEEFLKAVETYLNFHSVHTNIQKRIAVAVTEHAIPIGSGTVARTSMIPLEERAARAVIAWMRHQTTAYDNLSIRHIKGERRRVRRILAGQSVAVLQNYREGKPSDERCPLQKALKNQK
jgi:hypothetical protein